MKKFKLKPIHIWLLCYTSVAFSTQPVTTTTSPAVYHGPALPTTTGNEGFQPGSQTGGLTAVQLSNINAATLADQYLANVAPPATAAVSTNDSVTSQINIPVPPPPPGNGGGNNNGGGANIPICGIQGWSNANGHWACPGGGFALGNSAGACSNSTVYACP